MRRRRRTPSPSRQRLANRVDNVTFDELVEAYGTEYPIDVEPSTVVLPEAVEDALM